MLKNVLLLVVPISLAACSILPQRPANDYYALNVPIVEYPVQKRLAGSIQVYIPQMNPTYAGNAIYMLGDNDRVYKSDVSRFVAEPSDMIAGMIRANLESNGPWAQVLPPNTLVPADYSMIISISDFHGSAQQTPPRVFISFKVQVIRSSTNRTVFLQNYEASSPIEEKTAAGVVKAFSKALTEGLTSLQKGLNRTFFADK